MNTFLKTVIEPNAHLRRAYEYAKKVHRGEKRKNGEAMIDHCLVTARTVHEWQLGEAAIIAALFHHVREHDTVGAADVAREGGGEAASLVEHMGRLTHVHYNGLQRNVEHVRHLMLFLAEDVRTLLISLASRLHNMQSLYVFPESERRTIALETMDVYAPLAYQLGMYKLRAELEDLAFPYVYPKEHEWLMVTVRERREDLERRLHAFMPELHRALTREHIAVQAIEARAKHYASLYRKLLRYEMNMANVYDLVALRVIVQEIPDCYAALGIIHQLWTPAPDRFKDYIVMPKANGYRSLHTTVRTPEGQLTEVQIRTREMHEEAELGIAAHWAYMAAKGTNASRVREAHPADPEELAIIRQLREWHAAYTAEGEVPASLMELFAHKVLVLTPQNDVIELPKGATPVDFSYRIHTAVGNQAAGAKVNGTMVPLDYVLKSGDRVEILTQKNKQPSPSWLRFVKTAQARHHVNAALKKVRSMFYARSLRKAQATEIQVVLRDGSGALKNVENALRTLQISVTSLRLHPARWFGKYPLCVVSCRALSREERERVTQELTHAALVKKVTFKTVRQI